MAEPKSSSSNLDESLDFLQTGSDRNQVGADRVLSLKPDFIRTPTRPEDVPTEPKPQPEPNEPKR